MSDNSILLYIAAFVCVGQAFHNAALAESGEDRRWFVILYYAAAALGFLNIAYRLWVMA